MGREERLTTQSLTQVQRTLQLELPLELQLLLKTIIATVIAINTAPETLYPLYFDPCVHLHEGFLERGLGLFYLFCHDIFNFFLLEQEQS
jgi:hypothetical protein